MLGTFMVHGASLQMSGPELCITTARHARNLHDERSHLILSQMTVTKNCDKPISR